MHVKQNPKIKYTRVQMLSSKMINNEVTFFWGKTVPVITVWVLKYPFPTQQKLCIQNRNLYIHVQAIPTTKKKKKCWQYTNFESPRAAQGT